MWDMEPGASVLLGYSIIQDEWKLTQRTKGLETVWSFCQEVAAELWGHESCHCARLGHGVPKLQHPKGLST